jgi:methionyl-tRNA synthetase
MIYLQPIVPDLAESSRQFLNTALGWEDRLHPLLNHVIQPFTPLLTRLDLEEVHHMIETKPTEPSYISIDDFSKIELRIAQIVQAEAIPEAQKLLKLMVDVGEGKLRQIFAGIKEAYTPESLIGKYTVVVANLAPRQMRFGISEGMVLAAGPGGKELFILEPHAGAQPGMRVK